MVDWSKTTSSMIDQIKRCLLWLFYKLLIYLVGAWFLVREQVWDRHRPLPSLPRQEGKLVVLTGGGRGIGQQAVNKMVALGANVIIGVRNPESVAPLFGPEVTVLKLDLLCIKSVRGFAEKVLDLGKPVHVLINNAGIMFGPRRETEEGFEHQLCTNYLGHFLLSHLLLPSLVRAGSEAAPARIVNVSSCAHILGSWLDFTDLQLRRYYSAEQAYGNSKAAQILFTGYLTRVLSSRGAHVRVDAVHPGIIYSGLYDNVVGWQLVSGLASLCMKSVAQGGESLVQAAVDPRQDLLEPGQYLVNSRPSTSSAFTRDPTNQERLWDITSAIFDISKDKFGL